MERLRKWATWAGENDAFVLGVLIIGFLFISTKF